MLHSLNNVDFHQKHLTIHGDEKKVYTNATTHTRKKTTSKVCNECCCWYTLYDVRLCVTAHHQITIKCEKWRLKTETDVYKLAILICLCFHFSFSFLVSIPLIPLYHVRFQRICWIISTLFFFIFFFTPLSQQWQRQHIVFL